MVSNFKWVNVPLLPIYSYLLRNQVRQLLSILPCNTRTQEVIVKELYLLIDSFALTNLSLSQHFCNIAAIE